MSVRPLQLNGAERLKGRRHARDLFLPYHSPGNLDASAGSEVVQRSIAQRFRRQAQLFQCLDEFSPQLALFFELAVNGRLNFHHYFDGFDQRWYVTLQTLLA